MSNINIDKAERTSNPVLFEDIENANFFLHIDHETKKETVYLKLWNEGFDEGESNAVEIRQTDYSTNASKKKTQSKYRIFYDHDQVYQINMDIKYFLI